MALTVSSFFSSTERFSRPRPVLVCYASPHLVRLRFLQANEGQENEKHERITEKPPTR